MVQSTKPCLLRQGDPNLPPELQPEHPLLDHARAYHRPGNGGIGKQTHTPQSVDNVFGA